MSARLRNLASFKRKKGFRTLRQRILIVCEGEKTEPNYFRAFRVSSSVLISVMGMGANTESFVRRAVDEKAKVARTPEAFDQVWCVFERDSFPAQNFNNAFSVANANNIKIAYSNEAFELWYLLHFSYMQSALTRQQYVERLSEWLEKPYQKNSKDMYQTLLGKQPDALRNAIRLLNSFNPRNPVSNNPSTTVHLLVEELNKYKLDIC